MKNRNLAGRLRVARILRAARRAVPVRQDLAKKALAAARTAHLAQNPWAALCAETAYSRAVARVCHAEEKAARWGKYWI